MSAALCSGLRAAFQSQPKAAGDNPELIPCGHPAGSAFLLLLTSSQGC